VRGLADTPTSRRRLRRGPQRRGDRSQHVVDRYDAFVSYSHAFDGKLAPALQSEVEHFAKPWFRIRVRRLFRDNANLSASPNLWRSIETAMAASRWFVLLASPESAQSEWVEREVRWWLENRPVDHLLIVVTGGTVAWRTDPRRVDAQRTTALPTILVESQADEPRWVDLRDLHAAAEIDPGNPRFRDCMADIASAIDEVSKDELVGEHIRRRRQTMRWVRSTIASLVTLVAIAATSAGLALVQRNAAQREARAATSRQLAAQGIGLEDSQPNLARQLLVEAYRLSPTDQAAGALFGASVIPTETTVRGFARNLAYSPHRDLFAVATDEGISLFDPNTMGLLVTLREGRGPFTALAFSNDDRLLAAAGSDGIRLWDVSSALRPRLAGFLPSVAGVDQLAFARGVPLVVAVSTGAVLSVVDVAQANRPRLVASLRGFDTAGITNGLAVSPVGNLMAVTGDKGSIRLLDLSNTTHPVLLHEYSTSVQSLAISDDGQLLASGGSDDTCRLWSIEEPTRPVLRATISGQSLGVRAVGFAHDGNTMACGAGDGTSEVWDISDPVRPVLGTRLGGRASSIDGLTFSVDGRSLVSISPIETKTTANGLPSSSTLRRISLLGAQRSSALALIPTVASATPPTFTPDGRHMVAGFPTTIWDLSSRRQPRSLATVPTLAVGSPAMAYSHDGHLLATGLPIAAWDTSNSAQPRLLTKTALSGNVDVAEFSPRAPLLVTGSAGEEVKLWDLIRPGSPTLRATLAGSVASPQAVAFSPDGRTLATLGSQGEVLLWDVRTASPRVSGRIPSNGNATRTLTFASDNGRLIAGGTDGTVSVWDVRDKSRSRLVTSANLHTGPVGGIAVDRRGELSASAGEDGVIQLWTLVAGTRLTELARLNAGGPLNAAVLVFSPDGRTLAGATSSGLQLWDVAIPEILRRLCSESESISRAQWNQYLPDRTYDPPCA
jgi:WD40 repeat protein